MDSIDLVIKTAPSPVVVNSEQQHQQPTHNEKKMWCLPPVHKLLFFIPSPFLWHLLKNCQVFFCIWLLLIDIVVVVLPSCMLLPSPLSVYLNTIQQPLFFTTITTTTTTTNTNRPGNKGICCQLQCLARAYLFIHIYAARDLQHKGTL